jgi:hypothetical protein
MDVAVVADVDGDGKARSRNRLSGDAHRVADARVAVAARGIGRPVGEARELHDVEREVVAPLRAPSGGKRLELVGVALALASVRATLVPERAGDREADDRLDHRVVLARPERRLRRLSDVVEVSGSGGGAHLLSPVDNVFASLLHGVRHSGERRNLRDSLGADERLDAAPAPVVVENADRNPRARVDLAGEEVSHRRDVVENVADCDVPRTLRGGAELHRPRGRHVVELYGADVRIVLGLRLLRVAVDDSPAERHLGVGLSRDEPDVAYKNVCEHDGVLSGHLELGAVLHDGKRRKPDLPVARSVGLRLRLVAEEGNGHALARIRLAPDGQRSAVLQHHVVSENAAERHVGRSRRRRKGESCEQCLFHFSPFVFFGM